MDQTSQAATLLIQAGVTMGIVLCAHVYAVRHLSADDIPGFLRTRVEWSVRLRPWVIACACAMAVTGLVIRLG